jgi:hypothetical protein
MWGLYGINQRVEALENVLPRPGPRARYRLDFGLPSPLAQNRRRERCDDVTLLPVRAGFECTPLRDVLLRVRGAVVVVSVPFVHIVGEPEPDQVLAVFPHDVGSSSAPAPPCPSAPRIERYVSPEDLNQLEDCESGWQIADHAGECPLEADSRPPSCPPPLSRLGLCPPRASIPLTSCWLRPCYHVNRPALWEQLSMHALASPQRDRVKYRRFQCHSTVSPCGRSFARSVTKWLHIYEIERVCQNLTGSPKISKISRD